MKKDTMYKDENLSKTPHSITKRDESQDEFCRGNNILEGEKRRYFSLIKHLKGIVFWCNFDFTPIYFEGQVEAITGYKEEEFLHRNLQWTQIIYPQDLLEISNSLEIMRSMPDYKTEREYRIIRKDGQIRWVHEFIHNVSDDVGKPIFAEGAIYDITERKKMEEEIQALSIYDNLTGFYSSQIFLKFAEQHLKLSNRKKSQVLLFVINLSHIINGRVNRGYDRDDQALLEISKILKKTFRQSDVIGRISECKFAILFIASHDDSGKLLDRLKDNVLEHNSSIMNPLKTTLEIGTTWDNHKKTYSIAELLGSAEKNIQSSLILSVAQ